ncbi:MAG: hypothetical protein GDA43_18560 [Hormoscilla sp. SP5CHS1]|nr:hypothetical protein [Hormoscilla sp. SP12CHS1]MBC6454954.1 hypothetical protein [Hormoscilla sp. SP5CHS1]MBO1349403.1 hypothetical protein [Hormoscilla sp. GUM202]
MSYSQFTLESLKTTFGITIVETAGIFANVPEVKYSNYLTETLRYNIPLALSIASEKARSEMIVTPILIEIRKLLSEAVSLFSGNNFEVDTEKGLSGFCDFLISMSPEQLFIEAPVVTIVEAKNDKIESGLAQCMAEMIAAQLFNQGKENNIKTVYGVVTTGSVWKFMKLEEQVITIDLQEYFINQVGKIIGIIKSGIEANRS